MTTNDNNQDGGVPENAGEGNSNGASDKIELSKADYEALIADRTTLGSTKRELKEARKALEDTSKPKATPEQNQKPDDKLLERIERLALKSDKITHPDDVELARSLAKKWNTDIESIIADDDFKAKLERQQRIRANADATADLKGGAGTGQAKLTPAYWQAKGVPPSPTDVPNKKDRVAIIRAMMKNARTSGKVFYND